MINKINNIQVYLQETTFCEHSVRYILKPADSSPVVSRSRGALGLIGTRNFSPFPPSHHPLRSLRSRFSRLGSSQPKRGVQMSVKGHFPRSNVPTTNGSVKLLLLFKIEVLKVFQIEFLIISSQNEIKWFAIIRI